MTENDSQEGDDGYIFRTKITLRNGKVLYAHDVGIKAFRIPVKKLKSPKDPPEKK